MAVDQTDDFVEYSGGLVIVRQSEEDDLFITFLN